MKESNLLYQHLVPTLDSIEIWLICKPSFFYNFPYRKVVLTSNCSRYKSNVAHIAKTTLIVVSLTIGGNISLKSMPSF